VVKSNDIVHQEVEGDMAGNMHPPELISSLNHIANDLRIESLRMIHRRGQGHPGGTFSAAEIMAALFFHHMRIDPGRPDWEERDRFILSKGHASAILYAALAKRGFFPVDELETWGQMGGRLQGHPDRLKTPGVDMSAGCLGHGISIAAGLGLAARLKGLDYRTYVLAGDGECQAGVIWEGVMLAAKYRLSNVVTIVDFNEVQLDGTVNQIMPLQPFREKWEAFGWATIRIDGHDIKAVLDALDAATANGDKPTVIIAHTVKGKGVSFMEGKAEWHGKAPSDMEFEKALQELRK
jgi:transketolase